MPLAMMESPTLSSPKDELSHSPTRGRAHTFSPGKYSPEHPVQRRSDPVAIEGWIERRSEGFEQGRKRWFQLRGLFLYYYRQEDETCPVGMIDLSDARTESVSPKIIGISTELVGTTMLYFDDPIVQQQWLSAMHDAQWRVFAKATFPEAPPLKRPALKTTYPENTKANLWDFHVVGHLGSGAFAEVKKVKRTLTQEYYAMKVITREKVLETGLDQITAEVESLSRVKCPYIVKLSWAFDSGDYVYLILEIVAGGELFEHLQRAAVGFFCEDVVRFLGAELLLAIEEVHKKNIIFADLKPENVVLDEWGHLKLMDFGLAKVDYETNERESVFCGTKEYLAPETIDSRHYSKAVDYWGFGTMLYELLCGQPPFYDEDEDTMTYKICHAPLEFPDHVSEAAIELIAALLGRLADARLQDAEEIKRYKFFAGVDWDALAAGKVPAPYSLDSDGQFVIENEPSKEE
eukprot:TRINITY_DN85125_c0_g1_i1.p1 TRINITY_DN85125_c0_g1~~TRINITY_DN85125_c0_g1_i1.p1  ORF type:complete len:462 (-),score=44.69 TRINITY_DN85125_c0_g1_i1:214-1599(-)